MIRWAGETPIRIGHYSLSYRRGGRTRRGEKDPRWHSHVQIDWEHYKALKAMFVGLATRRSVGQLIKMFYYFPFEPYAPVRRQVGTIWRKVNRCRKRAGLDQIPKEVLPMRRRPVKPFGQNPIQNLRSLSSFWSEFEEAAA